MLFYNFYVLLESFCYWTIIIFYVKYTEDNSITLIIYKNQMERYELVNDVQVFNDSTTLFYYHINVFAHKDDSHKPFWIPQWILGITSSVNSIRNSIDML